MQTTTYQIQEDGNILRSVLTTDILSPDEFQILLTDAQSIVATLQPIATQVIQAQQVQEDNIAPL